MKVFIDCEFLEYKKQSRFFGFKVGKPILTTEIISIALVSEHNDKFYAESKEFNLRAAKNHKFVSTNVLPSLNKPETRLSLEEIQSQLLRWLEKLKHKYGYKQIELIGNSSAYDWWVLCTNIFGSWTKLNKLTSIRYYKDLSAVTNHIFSIDKNKLFHSNKFITHNALDDALWLKEAYFTCKAIIKDEMLVEFTKIAHESWKGLMEFMSSKGTQNEDGSFTLKPQTFEKWMLRANTDLKDLDDKLKNSHLFEANKYLEGLINLSPFLNDA